MVVIITIIPDKYFGIKKNPAAIREIPHSLDVPRGSRVHHF